jgi:hypothetical protein
MFIKVKALALSDDPDALNAVKSFTDRIFNDSADKFWTWIFKDDAVWTRVAAEEAVLDGCKASAYRDLFFGVIVTFSVFV